MRSLISSDVGAAQFLDQDADDAYEQDEVDLVGKHKAGRKVRIKMSETTKHDNKIYLGDMFLET